MKLYYMPGACPLASHIVLEWIGKPYELEIVARDALKQPTFLALNPLGAVPVLTDGDLTLTQSAAILEYLAELNPQLDLIGQTPRERAETRRWLGFCNADVHRTFALIFGVEYYSSDKAVQQQLVAKTVSRLVLLYGVANMQLAGKQWLTGKKSIADPYLYVMVRWAKAKKIDLANMADLQSFYARMEADPGVRAAVKAQGLT